MLLGLSSEKNGFEPDYEAINGSAADTQPVEHADLLTGLADAVYAREPEALEVAKARLVDAAGEKVMVDAVAVASNFFMMTRIADSTGTPLDQGTLEMSEAAREVVGVNDFVSRR